ncbi:MAG: SDR family NAD(P)-dependent oxidoreductase [Prevotellaceae bacterium]|jgi:NADP-dependent 3-hydroxy acid dehydrogenase YdfG|nr:SDR family NAD(P)-dependent oxidoreductase [Prevotellaceae bacterium]
MKKIALITGATAGIGKATAFALARKGYNIIVTGRRKERLVEVEREIASLFPDINIITLNFDIRNNQEVENTIDSLPEDWKAIDILVNNAGLAVGLNHIQDGVIDDWERMIDTNVKGLLYITRKVAPIMIERGTGHIVNIGSIAGKEVYENGNVYCATKHAVDALTKGMRLDMLQYGIKVTGICPGMVETEFSLVRFKGDEERAKNVYNKFQPLKPEDIADAVTYVVGLPPHVNINDLLIMPTVQANSTVTKRG